jgi:hypothetical protein
VPVGADVYDPSSGTLTHIANLDIKASTAALLPNGRVLIIEVILPGGPVPQDRVLKAELYDPSTGVVTLAADGIPERVGAPILIPNGMVLWAVAYTIRPPAPLAQASPTRPRDAALWRQYPIFPYG